MTPKGALYAVFALVQVLGFCTTQAAVKECWGPWVNDVKPSDANNRTDKEAAPSGNKVPAECQGKLIKVQCEDDVAEPFTGSPDKSFSHYTVTCNNKGLTCTPFKDFQKNNYTCPNFSIQAGCDCPELTSVKPTVLTGSTATQPSHSTVAPPGGDNGSIYVKTSLVLHLVLLLVGLAVNM